MHWMYTNRLTETIEQGPLSSNTFSGMKQLRYINLQKNRLRGSLPASIGECQHLYYADLSYNEITGAIPSSMYEIGKRIKVFENERKSHHNQWYCVGTELHYLNIQNNQIEGTLDDDIGRMTRLQSLIANHNRLSGTLPEASGAMRSLEVLDLAQTQISGTIPSSMDCTWLWCRDFSANSS